MTAERKASEQELGSRLQQARHYFRQHHANVEPDPAFAARVAAKLERQPVEILGWAAARLLPATLALVLILAWFSHRATADVQPNVDESPTEDLLAWVLEETETTP